MIKGEACDLVARPEAENSGEASFHPWPGRMFTGTWSKGFRSVPRSTLGWWRAPPLPVLGQPWILSRSHPFHVIVTAKSVVVTRVRADKPCNVAAAYRTGPTARLRWKQTALLYSWLSTLAQIITHFVELASQIPPHPSISTDIYAREQEEEVANLSKTGGRIYLSRWRIYRFSFSWKNNS